LTVAESASPERTLEGGNAGDWRARYPDKFVSAEHAVSRIRDGELLVVPGGRAAPLALCNALYRRKDELKGVRIFQTSMGFGAFGWYEPDAASSFSVMTTMLCKDNRESAHRNQVQFIPRDTMVNARLPEHAMRRDLRNADFFFVQVSPPDERGFCSFGERLFHSLGHAKHAKVVIGEVNPHLIRTGGDNAIHVSQFTFLVDHEPLSPASEETPSVGANESDRVVLDSIGRHVAGLVRDGDTIQLGIGSAAEATTKFLNERNDLGIHTEVLLPGMISLMKSGTITGTKKTVHVGKAVATAIICQNDDLEWIHHHPQIELYEMDYVNDLRVIANNGNMIAVNNAISIDLTGQLVVESIGSSMYSGTGGQLDFVIGALQSRGGRSVSCLPSAARSGQVSRIVPQHEAGTIVSVPRNLVDFVVTEWGMVNLQNRTPRERAEALISIAKPEFREELSAAAHRLFAERFDR
jgi:4-hydroxybutyrate CoA-transferase